MAQTSVKVLHTWPSMFGLRVLIALKEKGVAYEQHEENIPFHKSQLLLDSNPVHKKVPVLLHNGKTICESLIIVQYIDEAWPTTPGNSILPSDPYQRAIARFWADYTEKTVFVAGRLIVRNPNGDLREKGIKDLKESLVTLDGALRDVFGGGPYFGGQKIGLVDIALAPFLRWFEAYETLGGFKLMEEGQCPHLSKWAKMVLEYPSVKQALSTAPSGEVVKFASMLRKRVIALNNPFVT